MRSKKSPAGRLKLRHVALDTYHENVAYMHRDCEVYRAEGFQALSKVRISSDGHSVLAMLNVVRDESLVSRDELGLCDQAFEQLGLDEGTRLAVEHAEPPASMSCVRRKIDGERLNKADFQAITREIADNQYTKMEMAAFLVAADQGGLDRDEVLYYTEAMADTGHRLDWHESLVADKHCIGGIPGNRTSMLVVPIVAAHGMLIPKTSSRAITSPAGTADTMEVLAQVDLSPADLHRVVRGERGCLAWGGTAGLAPVDDILISVERPLGIDASGQMVASILAKKLAAGSTHLVVDIPVGPSAKIRSERSAMQLRKLFEYVGDRCGIHLEVMITDGRQPVGRGIGPALEARDIMQVLRNETAAPEDLRLKALYLAGRVIEFDPDVRGGRGFAIARDILESGRALAKMEAIIESQGVQSKPAQLGALTHEVPARHEGVVSAIDNYRVNRIASLAGAPMDKGAGVDLLKKVGDRVAAGEPLYRLHAQFQANFNFARTMIEKDTGFVLGENIDTNTLNA
ncbi:MAG: thymidine phosphorylase family protein [Gammaproteobacteria bacterium]|nr:thymidine phosphorylase family protein [Gammaproteobacteria bacterium]